MLNLQKIREIISERCEDRTYKRLTPNLYLYEIGIAQQKLAMDTKCLSEDTTVTSATGKASYALPSRCIGVYSVYFDGRPLNPTSGYELDSLNESTHWRTQTGPPTDWLESTSDRTRFLIYPIPTSSYNGKTIRIIYSYISDMITTVSQSIEVQEFALPALIALASYQCYKKLEIKYKSDRELRQSQIWQQHALFAKQDYFEAKAEIIKVLENFQKYRFKTVGMAGFPREEDEYTI